MNEADTCREYVIPGLNAAGWKDEQILPQFFFTDGRVHVTGGIAKRRARKFADYLLKYRRDTIIAIVEAKAEYKEPGDGLQQAKEYAEILGLPFAYATNGKGIVEFDYATGLISNLAAFPSPDSLWQRYQQKMGLTDAQAEQFLNIRMPMPALEKQRFAVGVLNKCENVLLSRTDMNIELNTLLPAVLDRAFSGQL